MIKNTEERKAYHKKYNKEWYQKNRERIKEKNKKYYWTHQEENKKYRQKHRKEGILYGREYRLKLRKVVLEYYGGKPPKCACCGEFHIEFLTVDHINGGGTQHRKRIGRGAFYRWLIKQNFPKEYQVLCMNCNFSLGHAGYCPHERER